MSGTVPFTFPGFPMPPPPGFPLPPSGFTFAGVPPTGFPAIPAQQKVSEEEISPPDECDPNETLYVNNVNDRVKEKDLKAYMLKVFSRFGKCDVIAMSSLRRRGQVWVVYESIEEAQSAKESLQGLLTFGKKMRISFSRNISDKTRERKGLPVRDKRVGPLTHLEKSKPSSDTTFFSTKQSAPKTSAPSYIPPNRILFLENLSESVTVGKLSNIFSKFPGFVEIRLISSRGVGFAEFVDEYKSQDPLMKLQGYELEPGRYLQITNAKR